MAKESDNWNFGSVIGVAGVLVAICCALIAFRESQTNGKQLQVAVQSLQMAIQQSNDDSIVESKRAKARYDSELRAWAPCLAVESYCNHRKIGYQKFFPGNGVPDYFMITVVPSRPEIISHQHERVTFTKNEQEQLGHVAVIKNVGFGPASDCKYRWRITGAIRYDSEPVSLPEQDPALHLKTTVLNGGESSYLVHMPSILSYDINLNISRIEGVLELTCRDIRGDLKRFPQKFTADTYYAPAKPGYKKTGDYWADISEVQFHFTSAGKQDGPRFNVNKTSHRNRAEIGHIQLLNKLPDYIGGWGETDTQGGSIDQSGGSIEPGPATSNLKIEPIELPE